MSAPQAIDWKSICKTRLENDFLECEKALKNSFFDTTQRTIEIQIARRIGSALERFEQGRWGICEICNKPIKRRRLIAQPCVEYCIECQEKLERQKRFGVSYSFLASRNA